MNGFIALFALVACAVAEPEADPQYLHYAAVNPHASAGLVKHPFSGAVTPDKTASVKIAEANHFAAKGLYAPYSVAPYTYAAAAYTYSPYTYAAAAAPYRFIAKRDADSEAQPEADAEADPQLFYSRFYNGLTHGLTYGLPYTYSHVASAPVITKTEVKAVKPATVTAKYVAAPAAYTYASPYAYASYPYASYAYAAPAAYHTIAKRDAEAEADPEAYYYSNYYSGYGYPRYSAYRAAYPYSYGAFASPYRYSSYRYY